MNSVGYHERKRFCVKINSKPVDCTKPKIAKPKKHYFCMKQTDGRQPNENSLFGGQIHRSTGGLGLTVSFIKRLCYR